MIDTRRIALRRPALEFPPDLLCSGTDGKEEDLRMRFANRTTRHALTAFASASNSKGHSGIHVGRFVECILEEILPFPGARTGLRERIRVSAAQIIRAVSANNYAVPCRQTVVSAKRGKGWSFMRSSLRGATDTDKISIPFVSKRRLLPRF
jgi:hypothetical protein